MKQRTVTSLFFLSLCLLLSSCTLEKNRSDLVSPLLQKKIDSLNVFYEAATLSSNNEEKKLVALKSFLKGADQLNVDSLQYKGLILQTKLLNQYGNLNKAIDKSYLLLKLAKQNKDSIIVGRALYKLGIYNKKNENYLKAFNYLNQSFKVRRNLNDSVNAGKSLMAMSNIQFILGDYHASKTTATDGLEYLKNSAEFRTKSGLYQNIARSFVELKSYKEALVWNDKIFTLLKDSIALNKIGRSSLHVFKNTRAYIFVGKKKYNKSVTILEALIKDEFVLEDTIIYSRILNNLGYIKFLQNPNNEESENMLLEALQIRQEENDQFGLFNSNIHLTKYYKEKDKEKSRYHAYQAYEHIKDFNDYEAQLEVLTLITELNPDSLEDHQRFKEAGLKLMELRKKTREIYAPTRFENENLLKENEEKNRKITEVRTQNTVYLLGMLILIMGIGFAIYFFRQRTRYLSQQNKIVQFQASYETETRIAKRLHDELGNDIFQVMLQYENDPHDPQIKAKLNSTYAKARDISRENNEFETDETFSEELNNMLQNYTKNGIRLIVIGFDAVPWEGMHKTAKITIYRVLQELMTNMQKHSQANVVKLRFSVINNQLMIKYGDNGVGMSAESLQTKNGLRNTEKRIQAIDGTLIFDSEEEKGFRAEIQIPI